jgi:peptidoglycan/xylan/chitin deacetylase (PgdA/CDA1 family)
MKSRYPFALLLIALTVTALWAHAQEAAAPASPPREIAVTFDDLPRGGPEIGLERTQTMTAALLASLKRHGIRAVGFVNESKLYVPGEIDERAALLKSWLDAGHELGNHTFSHPSFQTTPLPAFQEDVIRGETVTRLLLKEKGQVLRWFRHPFLRTGPDLATRDAFVRFLTERGYRVAPVTVENSDYIFSLVYSRAKERGDGETMRRAREAYLDFTGRQLGFWEGAAQAVAGRPIRQILLLHANELNADSMDAIAELLKRRGYCFLTLEEALEDEVYTLPDTYAGRTGPSWLYRWAVSNGARYDWRQEPQPPEDIQEMYESALTPARR